MTNHAKFANMESSGTQHASPLLESLTPGLMLITVGLILLAHQLDWVHVETLWKLWPVALILGGVSELEKWWREQR